MKKAFVFSTFVCVFISSFASADTFAEGTADQFEIEFVTISGDTNPVSGIDIGDGFTFTGVGCDYRIGTYEITNDQWSKFKSCYGMVTGAPSEAYGYEPYWTGSNIPAGQFSWFEAAQFVNWLNTSTGHQAAYKFIGTKGTNDYTFTVWDITDNGYDVGNPYRNSNAYYFLPTENEWVKAAYWNGTNVQTYATKAGDILCQGDGTNDGWNYVDGVVYATDPYGPWNVGSGSEELNGTYDMMGNLHEWVESPFIAGDYSADSLRASRGGSYGDAICYELLKSSIRAGQGTVPYSECYAIRVASVIPEPATLSLLAVGGLALLRKRK